MLSFSIIRTYIHLYVADCLEEIENLFLIGLFNQNRPKKISTSFESNRIKKNDRHYLFVWKIREMEEIESTPKINQDYKRNSWWSCIPWPVGTNRKWFLIMWWNLSNVNEKPKCLFEAKSLMILLPYLIRWWIRKFIVIEV